MHARHIGEYLTNNTLKVSKHLRKQLSLSLSLFLSNLQCQFHFVLSLQLSKDRKHIRLEQARSLCLQDITKLRTVFFGPFHITEDVESLFAYTFLTSP